MRKISFVTSNKGKVESLQNRLPNDIKVVQANIEIPELQGDNVEDVVREKARAAYQILKKPVVVQDSAFHIDALGGFPGLYIKYINKTIGPEGILKLLEGVTNRSCFFRMGVGYADQNGKIYIFMNNPIKKGLIANEIAKVNSKKAWSDLWKIYIPNDSKKPLALMSASEIDYKEKSEDKTSEFAHFASWLIKNL